MVEMSDGSVTGVSGSC